MILKELRIKHVQTGTDRVLRGGSWINDATTAPVARRYYLIPPRIRRNRYNGFRFVRNW